MDQPTLPCSASAPCTHKHPPHYYSHQLGERRGERREVRRKVREEEKWVEDCGRERSKGHISTIEYHLQIYKLVGSCFSQRQSLSQFYNNRVSNRLSTQTTFHANCWNVTSLVKTTPTVRSHHQHTHENSGIDISQHRLKPTLQVKTHSCHQNLSICLSWLPTSNNLANTPVYPPTPSRTHPRQSSPNKTRDPLLCSPLGCPASFT